MPGRYLLLLSTLLMGFAVAGDASPPASPLDAFEPLLGHCWRGEAPGGGSDTHCYAAMLDGHFVRDRHQVPGATGSYRGETIYSVDPDNGRIRYTYYNSLGGVSTGGADVSDRGLRFDDELYTDDQGNQQHFRSSLVLTADGDAYQMRIEALRDGQWAPVSDSRFEKIEDNPFSD